MPRAPHRAQQGPPAWPRQPHSTTRDQGSPSWPGDAGRPQSTPNGEREARFTPFSAPCHEETVSRAFAKALKTSRGDTLTDKHTQRAQQPPEDLTTAPSAASGWDSGTGKGQGPPARWHRGRCALTGKQDWMHPAGERLTAAGSSRDDKQHQKGQKERLRGHQINQSRVQAAAKSGTSPR